MAKKAYITESECIKKLADFFDEETFKNKIIPFSLVNEICEILQGFKALMEEYGVEKRTASLNRMNIVNILQYIDEHYQEDLNVEQIAKHFGFTKQYFAKIFNNSSGRLEKPLS